MAAITNKVESVAIIPARGGSVRLPRKNILDVNGKPMLAYPVQACLHAEIFDRVIVSTEDNEIASVAKDYGAEVIDRPCCLATNQSMVRNVVRHAIECIEGEDGVRVQRHCIVYPTAILIKPWHLIESERLLRDNKQASYVLAVTKVSPHPYKSLAIKDGFLEPVFPEYVDAKSQSMDDLFASAGAFHWMRTSDFMAGGEYWVGYRMPYVLESRYAVDIDEYADLEYAKLLLSKP